jgi:hypothetical protein
VVAGIVEGAHPGGEHVVLLRVVAPLDEGGPVHHLQVDVEAHVLELLLAEQREVVHPLVLLGGHEADRLLLVARLLQEPLGLLPAVLVPRKAGELGVPGGDLHRGQATVHAVELFLAARHVPHDGLDVDGGLPGLTQLLVRHQAFLLVEDGHEPVVGLGDDGTGARRGLETVEGIQVQVVREVQLAGLHLGHARRHLGHRHPADLVHVCRLAAAVAVRLLVARLVVVEAHHADVLVGLPLRELVGAGAHVLGRLHLGRELLGDLLRVDGPEVVGDGERDEHDRGFLLQLHFNCVAVHRPQLGDLGEERLAVVGLLAPAVERGHHVLGGHLLAVVELHTLAELEGVGEPVPADGVALGQHGDRLLVAVEAEEPFVDVVGERLGDAGRRPVRVQRGRLAEIADPQHAALLLRVGGRGPEHEQRRHRERGQQP